MKNIETSIVKIEVELDKATRMTKLCLAIAPGCSTTASSIIEHILGTPRLELDALDRWIADFMESLTDMDDMPTEFTHNSFGLIEN